MNPMATTRQSARAESQVTINIIYERAGYQRMQELAKEMNSRLPTLKEFITSLKNNPNLYAQTKGELFWLADEPGLAINGCCKIDYDRGTIKEVSKSQRDALPRAQRAHAYSGDGPLILGVYSPAHDGRLSLAAADSLNSQARVALVPLAKAQADSTAVLTEPLSETLRP